MAKVLESYFTAFIKILKTDQLAFPVNYNEGPISMVKKVAAVTGINLSEDEIETMKQRSGFHGKYPGQHFDEPTVDAAIPAYLESVFELYEKVESIRKKAFNS